MYDAMKRHEIQVLDKAGLCNAAIVETTQVSLSTVQRVRHESPIGDHVPSPAERGVGRPSKVEAFRSFVAEILKKEPALVTVEILHRARAKGYDGGKSALYDLVAKLRPSLEAPMVRFEGLAGEFSQNDFGSVLVRYGAGGYETIHFFAARLKYSRFVYVEIVPDERVESLVRALLNSFEAFSGVPLVCVFDNPKTVVIRVSGTTIEWNKTFGQVALDYRFGPELCAPRRANQKGSVENLVGWVKGSFFKVRRFHDRQDLLLQLKQWLHEANEERPSRATGLVPRARMAEEEKRLRPLPIPAKDYALSFPTMVGPTAVVEHDGIRYSMPPESVGFPATLYLHLDRVRIVARRYEAEHPRFPLAGSSSVLPVHRSAMLAAVSGRRARLYYMRQQLLDLGSELEALLTELVHRHPCTWQGEVEVLFENLQAAGERRFLRAVRTAVSRRLFGARFVVDLLKKDVG